MYFVPPSNLFFILVDLLEVVVVLIIVEVIISWGAMMGSISPSRPWVRTIRRFTEPILMPFRKIAPPEKLRGIDISPILAIFLINFVQNLLIRAGAGSMLAR